MRRSGLPVKLFAVRISGTTIDPVVEFLLGRTDLGQKCYWIERGILLAQL